MVQKAVLIFSRSSSILLVRVIQRNKIKKIYIWRKIEIEKKIDDRLFIIVNWITQLWRLRSLKIWSQ